MDYKDATETHRNTQKLRGVGLGLNPDAWEIHPKAWKPLPYTLLLFRVRLELLAFIPCDSV